MNKKEQKARGSKSITLECFGRLNFGNFCLTTLDV